MKPVVVYPLVATAILLFITLSKSSQKDFGNVKLSRRLGNKHAPFDPIVAEWERLTEEKGLPHQHYEFSLTAPHGWDFDIFSEVFEDSEEYFSEEGQINITGRLKILFPLLDRSPKDGAISLTELEAWNVWQATEQLIYRTKKEMEEHDRNGDDAITLEEYLPQFNNNNTDKDDMNYGQAGWWNAKFVNADIDINGYLNFTELTDFLHPEDSNNEKMQIWVLKEKMRGMDSDKDGKLNFVEFRDQAYDTYKKYFEFQSGENDAPNAEEKFAELDNNKDRLLTEEELKPLIHHLHPGELTYAKFYTKHLIQQADDDRDGKLTLDEMLDHPHIFYETVIKESDYDDDALDDDDYFHDEF